MQIRQRYAWRPDIGFQTLCNNTSIANQGLIGSYSDFLGCVGGGSCRNFTSLPATVICTDFSPILNYSSGERYSVLTLPVNRSFVIGFYGSAWIRLALKGYGDWQVTGRIDLTVRPDGKINTPPMGNVLPITLRQMNRTYYQTIVVADIDVGDTVRCRWAVNNGSLNSNGYDECASVCAPTLPAGYMLFPDNCTVAFTVNDTGYFAMTIQIEDYLTPTSLVPMSSVPIQFVVYSTGVAGVSLEPTIFGSKPNGGLPLFFSLNLSVFLFFSISMFWYSNR